MKIFYISTSTIPSRAANSIHVMKMCAAINKDHKVTLIAPNRNKNLNSQKKEKNLRNHYGIAEIFKIKFINFNKISEGISYSINTLRYVLNNKPDLIISRSIYSALLTTIFGFKTILELHSPPINWKETLALFIISWMSSLIKVIVITKSLFNYYSNTVYFKKIIKNFIILPDGVDLERFSKKNIENQDISNKFNFPKDKFIIGYVGHLYEGRGIDLIMDLALSCLDDYFIIIGGDDLSIKYYKEIAKSKKINNLKFFGFVDNMFLPFFYSKSHILLMPFDYVIRDRGGNNTASWASPMKLFEYMATKKPIISSDLPVFKEILNNNNSVLCSPQDRKQWVSAINKLKANIEYRNNLANKAYQDVKKYTWKIRVDKILKDFI